MIASIAPGAELTARQRAAVAHRGGNLLVEAVPGSGKTRVIVARFESLLAQGVSPAKILLLTFSRRAVGELRTRLAGVVADDRLPEIRTFHGFAARLLAGAGHAGGARRLLSEPAERALFENIVTTTPLASLPAGVGRSVHFRAAASRCVDEIRRSPPAALRLLRERATPRLSDLLALTDAQHRVRARLGVADYDDLVARALALASEPGSDVASVLHGRYAHVLVDEFQDTDALQLALLERFTAEIFAVGDAAQAIYGFRGAARDALARARIALKMTTLPLDESFRCPAGICALACSVWPSPPQLHSHLDTVAEISFRRAASPQDEAALLGEAIAAAIDGGMPANAIGVLVRSAEPMAGLVEAELRARGIAVAREGGENVLDDLAVDAICAALKAFAQPAEIDRWVQLLSHPALGIAPLALRLTIDAAAPRSVDDACGIARKLPAGSRVSGARLASALDAARAYWEADDPVRAARSFAFEADILGFVIAGDERGARRSAGRIENFLDALADVRDVRKRVGSEASSAAVLRTFLECSESWRAGAQAVGEESGVRILTVHAAKGLEFAFVAIADAVEGRFPQSLRGDALLSARERETARICGVDLGTSDEEQSAQERALWYVAVTRTKRKLLVTWSETEADGSPQRASRFIPLEARVAQAQRPSFRWPLHFERHAALSLAQTPAAARLVRPLRTTALDTWLTCRRKFYYSALLRIGGDERGLKGKLGRLVHDAIQAFHATTRDFRNVDSGAHAGWASALREEARTVASSPEFKPFDSALEAEAAMRAADRLLDRYARELEASARTSDGGFEVVGSEERVTYVFEGVALSGQIDRIDRFPDGSLRLVDVKTGAFTTDKAMAGAFAKLAASASDGTLWVKATPPGNPQLALYRHAKPATRMLAYVYLNSHPKFDDFADTARVDRLDVVTDAAALASIDGVLSKTFFEPWTAGRVTSLEPTRNGRTCRHCEFVTVCPGYLEDED